MTKREMGFIKKVLLSRGTWKALIALLPGKMSAQMLRDQDVSSIDQILVYMDYITQETTDKGNFYNLTTRGKRLAVTLESFILAVQETLPGD